MSEEHFLIDDTDDINDSANDEASSVELSDSGCEITARRKLEERLEEARLKRMLDDYNFD